MFFLLPENCKYPFGPLFRLPKHVCRNIFPCIRFINPIFLRVLMLIDSCKSRSPVQVLLHFATLIITTDFDFSHLVQLLADSDSDGISETPGFYWHHFTGKIFLGQHNYTRLAIYITLYLPQKRFNVLTKRKGPNFWSLKILN